VSVARQFHLARKTTRNLLKLPGRSEPEGRSYCIEIAKLDKKIRLALESPLERVGGVVAVDKWRYGDPRRQIYTAKRAAQFI
jgi:hypothetical protein